MLFWITCALLTVAVTVVTLRPILSQKRVEPDMLAADADLQVYKDQLAEVDRDVAKGLLGDAEAESARLEVSRRILATEAKQSAAVDSERSAFSGMVFYLTAAIVVTSSLGLYLALGSPGYSNQPHAVRASKPPGKSSVDELVARVEARLREVPNDGQGWEVLAPVYLKRGRNEDAVRAYRKAIELLGENRPRLRGLAEALLASTNGVVVPEARAAYEKILSKEPNLIAPRFWLAVAKEQDGDHKAAATAYRSLLSPDAGGPVLPEPLKRLINERLAAVGGSAGKGVQQPKAPVSEPQTGKGAPPPAGMAEGMSAKQRAEMIEQMVSGLAERLNKDGGTLEEWQRLIRAYSVLGRREKAAEAVTTATQQFATDAEQKQKLQAFARSLGLPASE